MPRVLLLLPSTSYKARDFMDAAERLGVEVVVGTDRGQALEREHPGTTLAVDRVRPERGVEAIRELAARRPLDAVLGVDDETTLVAAMAAEALGLRHQPVAAVRASRDKSLMRRALADAGLRTPAFRVVDSGADPAALARTVPLPCVIKPLALAAGRGVLRADDLDAFVAAFARVRAIVASPSARRQTDPDRLLVEEYLSGPEVAVEALLDRGRLRVLAVFDKPDPLEGPTFEETLYVTPSRHAPPLVDGIVAETARGCAALGLADGPVHAELRITDGAPWIVEIAARTIGGLCSRTLRFGAGIGLEELVLRHALGLGVPAEAMERETRAAGVMMLPVPARGRLAEVRGLDEARAVPGVEDVVITAHRGAELVPLPEGHRYVGFAFARGDDPASVEAALREAHARLGFEVDPA